MQDPKYYGGISQFWYTVGCKRVIIDESVFVHSIYAER
jgi:hypothetical protein